MTDPSETSSTPEQRWRLLLGADPSSGGVRLSADQQAMDLALTGLYDQDGPGGGTSRKSPKSVGHGASAPRVARWLGDIRRYFPSSVVKVMQTDAIDRLGLKSLLLEPEVLSSVQPDVRLVATLASLNGVLPERSRETARQVVAQVVAEVEARMADKVRQAVRGALDRATRTSRPRLADVDWNRTIAANLKNYLPEHRTVVPERLIGHARRRTGVQREFVLCVDQSGSMASSVVHASIFACVMASISSIRTRLVVYDTAVVDLTDKLADPVDLIFGTQLGGGNDTPLALAYCETLVTSPRSTVLLLISDLYEGSGSTEMLRRLRAFKDAGVTVVVLLALDDDGTPSYDHANGAALAAMGIPAFACTPDAFPDLLAEAIQHGDLTRWVEQHDGS